MVAVGDIATSIRANSSAKELLIGPGDTDGYYVVLFRGSSFCPTCDIMNDLTGKLLGSQDNSTFEGKEGENITFKVINFETPGNEHYLFDYDLYTTTIVLIEQKNSYVKRWKNLQNSWEKAEDAELYNKYLTHEISNFREGE